MTRIATQARGTAIDAPRSKEAARPALPELNLSDIVAQGSMHGLILEPVTMVNRYRMPQALYKRMRDHENIVCIDNLIYDETSGKVIVPKHDYKATTPGALWPAPGGMVEMGETWQQTIAGLFKAELGIAVDVSKAELIAVGYGVYRFNGPKKSPIYVFLHRVRLPPGFKFPDNGHFDGYCLVGPEHLQGLRENNERVDPYLVKVLDAIFTGVPITERTLYHNEDRGIDVAKNRTAANAHLVKDRRIKLGFCTTDAPDPEFERYLAGHTVQAKLEGVIINPLAKEPQILCRVGPQGQEIPVVVKGKYGGSDGPEKALINMVYGSTGLRTGNPYRIGINNEITVWRDKFVLSHDYTEVFTLTTTSGRVSSGFVWRNLEDVMSRIEDLSPHLAKTITQSGLLERNVHGPRGINNFVELAHERDYVHVKTVDQLMAAIGPDPYLEKLLVASGILIERQHRIQTSVKEEVWKGGRHPPKLIMFDLDSTLAEIGQELDPRVKAAVLRLLEKGYMVVIVSGKTLEYLKGGRRFGGIPGVFLAGEDGGIILDPETGNVMKLADKPESFDKLDGLMTEKFGGRFTVQGNQLKLSYFPKDKQNAEAEIKEFKAFLDRAISDSGLKGVAHTVVYKDCVDVVLDSVSKRLALEWFREKFGLKREDVIAVGDSLAGDGPMLEVAGFPILITGSKGDVTLKNGARVKKARDIHEALTTIRRTLPPDTGPDVRLVQEVETPLKRLRRRDAEGVASVRRPWGKFVQFDVDNASAIKLLHVEAGQSLSYQAHGDRSELWTVVSGKIRVTLEGKTADYTAGDTVKVPLGAKHKIEGIEAAVVLEIAYGKFDENDERRFEDFYER